MGFVWFLNQRNKSLTYIGFLYSILKFAIYYKFFNENFKKFKTNVRIYQEADQGTENRDELLMGTRMVPREFYLNFETKERRTRGRWR